jgi:hypothetical protein
MDLEAIEMLACVARCTDAGEKSFALSVGVLKRRK